MDQHIHYSREEPLLRTFSSFQDPNESTLSSVYGYNLTPDEAISHISIALLSAITFGTLGHISYALPYLQTNARLPSLLCEAQDGSQFQCSQQLACSDETIHFTFKPGLRTWIQDFDLLCDSLAGTTSWLGTSFFLGYLVSSLLFLRLADLCGRKPIIIAGLILHLITASLLLFSSSKILLYFFVFSLGVRGPMASQLANIHAIELSRPQVRSYMTTATASIDGLTGVWLPFFFYYLQDWHYLFYLNLAVVLICLALYLTTVPQSPRFFISKHQYKAARLSYARVAKWNGKPMFSEPLRGEPINFQSFDAGAESLVLTPPKANSLADLWHKNKHLRKLMILVPVLGVFAEFAFYGILYGLSALKGSIFINGGAMGLADVTAGLAVGPLTNFLGRKQWMKAAWVITGLACAVYPFQPHNNFQYINVWIAKFGATSSFATLYLVTAQIFPTEFRSTMTGVLKATASIGGVVAPLVSGYLQDYFMIVIAGMAACGFWLSYLLKETKYLRMNDDLNQRYKRYTRF